MDRKEAYTYAIENEIKSANLYRVLANGFEDKDLVKTLESLATLEKMHEEKLVEMYVKEFKNEPFRYDKKVLPRIDVRRNVSDPKSILEYAIDREIAMADQYGYMADNSTSDDIKSFFLCLVKEEMNHKEMLQAELNRIQGTMIWFDDSELNGLMEY